MYFHYILYPIFTVSQHARSATGGEPMVPKTLDDIEEKCIAQIPDQFEPMKNEFDSYHFDDKWDDDKLDIGQMISLYLLYICKFLNILYFIYAYIF